MNMPAQMTRPRHDLTRELAPLIAGAESLGLAALVNLETGKALTLGEPPKPAAGSAAVTGAQLVLLARALSGRASEPELAQLAASCSAQGGIATASLLLANHDLVLSRIANSTEALCLVVRHAPASIAALDSIVHARGVQTRLLAARRAADAHARPQTTHRRTAGWKERAADWVSRFRREAGKRAETQPESAPQGPARPLREACEIDDRVLAADLLDLRTLAHLASYRRSGCGIPVPRSAALAEAAGATFQGRVALAPLVAQYGLASVALGKARVQIGRQEVYLLRVPYFPALRIPFDDREVLMVAKPPRGNPALDWTAMDKAALNLLRARIGALLSSGLTTQMSPFPANQNEFQAIVDRLAALPEADLIGRLDIGGFAPRPVVIDEIEQRCAECIYYLG